MALSDAEITISTVDDVERFEIVKDRGLQAKRMVDFCRKWLLQSILRQFLARQAWGAPDPSSWYCLPSLVSYRPVQSLNLK